MLNKVIELKVVGPHALRVAFSDGAAGRQRLEPG